MVIIPFMIGLMGMVVLEFDKSFPRQGFSNASKHKNERVSTPKGSRDG